MSKDTEFEELYSEYLNAKERYHEAEDALNAYVDRIAERLAD